MQEKKEKRILHILDHVDNVINWTIRILIIPIFLCGIYIIADTVGVYADAGAEHVQSYKPDILNAETLGKISGNCVAWLEIDDTKIDYPIMQGTDNTEYLNRDPYGNYSLSGSIFMDYRNASDFTDEYSLVYGHHMTAGLMFGAFDNYTNEEYFRKHLTGKLTVGDKEYKLFVYAFFRCDTSDSEVFNTSYPQEERLAFFKEKAWFSNGSLEGKRVLALTTCKTPGATDRSILMCWIEE